MWLQACLNGSRTSTEHLAVPLTPAALADDARRCFAAGAPLGSWNRRGSLVTAGTSHAWRACEQDRARGHAVAADR